MYVFDYTNKEECSYPYFITSLSGYHVSFSEEIMNAILMYGSGVGTLYDEIMDNPTIDQILLTDEEYNYIITIFNFMGIKYTTKI